MDENKTILEIKLEHEGLRENIKKLLESFEDSTGMQIENIRIERITSVGYGTYIHQVFIDVNLF